MMRTMLELFTAGPVLLAERIYIWMYLYLYGQEEPSVVKEMLFLLQK